jgi:hypothetical protein
MLFISIQYSVNRRSKHKLALAYPTARVARIPKNGLFLRSRFCWPDRSRSFCSPSLCPELYHIMLGIN